MIYAHLCVGNEANRYLAECLAWLAPMVDMIHVYDDSSWDSSREIALGAGAVVDERLADRPSFEDDESLFRQDGWECMAAALSPNRDDWILCLDADEFVTATFPSRLEPTERELLRAMTKELRSNADGFTLPVAEVFGWDGADRPKIRVDGWWGKITAPRLVRWTGAVQFQRRRRGGGSIPIMGGHLPPCDFLTILHYGYADAGERAARADRYRHEGGHNPRHVQSITRPGSHRPWTGKAPVAPRR